jgi:ribosomal protein S18 acetylase RimI-like enzyme
MKISYRKLASADSTQYREIRLESLKLHPESFGSTFEEQSKLPKLMFEKALEQPTDDRFVVGAFDRQALIGICGFIPFALDNKRQLRNTGAIIQMYVKPAYRGRKIGLSLVKAAIDEAFNLAAIEQIVLGVKAGNMSAIRVYEQAGFQTYQPEGSETEVNEDGLLMVIRRDA